MQIDYQPDWPLAFLTKQFGMSATASRRDAPVDAARIVASDIRTYFFKL
jgi:hypothetical protein